MNRRIALRQMGMITAGAMLLPACVHEGKKVSMALKNMVITGDQEALLAEIVGTIIPATDIPGAKELNVHQFVLRMVDDCQDPESQQHFVTGINQLDGSSRKRYGKLFQDCTAEERMTFLREVAETTEGENPGDELENRLPALYALTKRYTVQGYLSSEYIMTNVLPYTMVPGGFTGCIEIKDKRDIQTVIG